MHVRPPVSRREFLCKSGGGFGALALSYLLSRDLGPLARAEEHLERVANIFVIVDDAHGRFDAHGSFASVGTVKQKMQPCGEFGLTQIFPSCTTA